MSNDRSTLEIIDSLGENERQETAAIRAYIDEAIQTREQTVHSCGGTEVMIFTRDQLARFIFNQRGEL